MSLFWKNKMCFFLSSSIRIIPQHQRIYLIQSERSIALCQHVARNERNSYGMRRVQLKFASNGLLKDKRIQCNHISSLDVTETELLSAAQFLLVKTIWWDETREEGKNDRKYVRCNLSRNAYDCIRYAGVHLHSWSTSVPRIRQWTFCLAFVSFKFLAIEHSSCILLSFEIRKTSELAAPALKIVKRWRVK